MIAARHMFCEMNTLLHTMPKTGPEVVDPQQQQQAQQQQRRLASPCWPLGDNNNSSNRDNDNVEDDDDEHDYLVGLDAATAAADAAGAADAVDDEGVDHTVVLPAPPERQRTTRSRRRSRRTVTLYLIRHGEACHNIREKEAKRLALREALEEGYGADSAEAKMRADAARAAILEDPAFFDAALSDLGKRQASCARDTILKWTTTTSASARSNNEGDGQRHDNNDCDDHNGGGGGAAELLLPAPTLVFVSPLQRALKTADLIFPQHDNIHVREELRERLTGRPADNRASSATLSKRPSFARFSFCDVVAKSRDNFQDILDQLDANDDFLNVRHHLNDDQEDELRANDNDCDNDNDNDCDHANATNDASDSCEGKNQTMDPTSTCSPRPGTDATTTNRRPPCWRGSSLNSDREVEDEEKLRGRTRKLLELLAGRSQREHEAVAIVTHKGFLRSLERGLFGNPDAAEFQNCEVRAYQLSFVAGSGSNGNGNVDLEGIQRLK